jgi:hypothetical protein
MAITLTEVTHFMFVLTRLHCLTSRNPTSKSDGASFSTTHREAANSVYRHDEVRGLSPVPSWILLVHKTMFLNDHTTQICCFPGD